MHIMCIWPYFRFLTPKCPFWPQNDLFWPQRWPRMTSRCTPLNSEENFQSNGMHIMCIWPYFRFLTPKWPFLTPKMTSDDLEMHAIEFRRKFPIDPYAYGHIYMVRSIVSINGIKSGHFWTTCITWCTARHGNRLRGTSRATQKLLPTMVKDP